jgi:hypothetical protein
MTAAAALTPRVRMMILCDEVRKSKTEPGVFHLKSVRQEIKVGSFPSIRTEFCLFLVLSNTRPGKFPASICIVSETSDKTVHYAHLDPPPVFGNDGGLFIVSVPIGCRFPEEGIYCAQMWFFQQQGSDVLKGEFPFLVAAEDHLS